MTTTTTIRRLFAAGLLLGAAAAPAFAQGARGHDSRARRANRPAATAPNSTAAAPTAAGTATAPAEPAGHHHADDAEQRRPVAAFPDRGTRRAPGKPGDAAAAPAAARPRPPPRHRAAAEAAARRGRTDRQHRLLIRGRPCAAPAHPIDARSPPRPNPPPTRIAEDAWMPDDALIGVKPDIAAKASVTAERHRAMSEAAKRDPEGFWRGEMRRVAWMKEPTRIKNVDFTGNVSHQMVRGRRAQRLRLLPRPPPRRRQRRPRRDHLGRRRPEQRRQGHLPRAAPAAPANSPTPCAAWA